MQLWSHRQTDRKIIGTQLTEKNRNRRGIWCGLTLFKKEKKEISTEHDYCINQNKITAQCGLTRPYHFSLVEHIIYFPLLLVHFCLIFLACIFFLFYRESFQNEFFWRIEMWVSFIIPPNLSLIIPLAMEIWYSTGIPGITDKHTD